MEGTKIEVYDVFGITSRFPTHTYVDRAGLDDQFRRLLKQDKHIVLHGASKQGKTVLRRKYLPPEQTVEIQCGSGWTLERLYHELLRKLGVPVEQEQTRSGETKFGVEGEAGGKAGIPWFGQADAKAGLSGERTSSKETKAKIVGGEVVPLGAIIDAIKKSGKRVVLEDVHYMTEEERINLSLDLKAFYDAGVFLIIVGVWTEHNLFAMYNPDLSGRIEEIDPRWTDDELRTVIEKGEQVLNITIHESLKKQLIADSYRSVGLLQDLVLKVCLEHGVEEKNVNTKVLLNDEGALARARSEMCKSLSSKYGQLPSMFERGFRASAELKVYSNILRAVVEAPDTELVDGLPYADLLKKVTKQNPDIRPSDLTAAVKKIDRLQLENGMQRPILSYQEHSRLLQVVDADLLFYRRYSGVELEWSEQAEAERGQPVQMRLVAPDKESDSK